MIEPVEDTAVNKFPTEERPLIFQVWKIDHFCLTPFELSISDLFILFIVRTGKHVFKWEYLRRKAR